ncbi:hypothetical protein, conserved [Babesia ovata]|uniref:Uncharacterized protein n=1 Tax=Babesia ovata TaxID=189622 RepID=A0A2H6KJ85_9APIC|nr:uncharacterized protein BOVATA_045390 [Babesia ovata]GBE63046.1 hypothetical protein, conserved [Babesia ovata]
MSFLHGVLQTVKSDESVTTYDIDRSNDINNVLRILHDSVGKGRKAFPEAVRQVDTFTGRVTGHLGKYYQEVEKKQGEDLTTQLSGWKGTVGKIQDEVNNIETYNVNVLDSTLKNRLMHEMSVIHSSVLLLKNSANEEVFGLQVKQVDSTLVKQRDDVLQKINEECAVLQTRVENGFKSIDNRIIELTQTAMTQFRLMRDAIAFCRDSVNYNFDDDYRIKILDNFDAIKIKVSGFYNKLQQTKNDLGELVNSAWSEFGVENQRSSGLET